MALVVNQSKYDVTVIILDDNGRRGEAEALTNLFVRITRMHTVEGIKFSAEFPELDELTNALTGLPYEDDEETTDIDRKRP